MLETAGPIGYAIVDQGSERGEVRVRLPALRIPAAQVQEIEDGLVKSVRLEPATGGALLRVALDSPAGQIKDFSLHDPYRIVVDLYRTKEGAEQEGAQGGAMIGFGVIGIFIGPVLLAVAYTLLSDWIESGEAEDPALPQ